MTARGLSPRPARGVRIRDVLAVPAGGASSPTTRRRSARGARARRASPTPAGVRRPAEAVSVLLVLDDGHVAHGDCASVQYSGVGGREPRLEAETLAAPHRRRGRARLRGREVTASAATTLLSTGSAPPRPTASPRRCSTPPRTAPGRTMAEVIRAEWGLDHAAPARPGVRPDRRGPLRQRRQDDPQAGRLAAARPDQRRRRSSAGRRALVDYVRWVRDRVRRCARSPRLRAGPALRRLRHARRRIGDDGARRRHGRGGGAAVRAARRAPGRRGLARGADRGAGRPARALRARGSRVQIVADEWANTVDDIRAFNAAGAADVVQVKTPDLGACTTPSTRCSTAARTASSPTSAAPATRPSASAQVSAHLAHGARCRPDAGQARDGRRRGPVDRPQRDGAHARAQPPRGKRVIDFTGKVALITGSSSTAGWSARALPSSSP